MNLSLSEMVKNEPMLTSAFFFSSDTLNAFLFGHGPIMGGSISGLGRVSAVFGMVRVLIFARGFAGSDT